MNRPVRNIVVDIDNTLWDFAPVLYEHLAAVSPNIPAVDRWGEWEFWEDDLDSKTFYRILKTIHMKQEEFVPYEDARPFLMALREDGFHIIIASHRESDSAGPTRRWLDRYGLPYDQIHLSNDKSVLFDQSVAIVDDSPSTLEKARKAGLVRAGLRRPWNSRTDHPLFNTLHEILVYLEKEL
jgi:HAD superfamily hydrolase (TIGR01509 family)